ncbi:MAG: aldehyde dehydrogenase family protein [Planctomycetes bacterium]|nr:aldehyde dehydrogenase family protein [Planctomycetota bacterium]
MRAPSGLKIEDVIVGAGAVAEPGATVTIECRGWLNRGDEFGSSLESFRIGQRRLIAGLERGVIGMRVGGVRKLRVSPHLAYRDQAVPGVPPNAVLNFEVKLLSVEKTGVIMSTQPLLIAGSWRASAGTETFHATNPATGDPLPGEYPVSPWSEIVEALSVADAAARRVRGWSGERFAAFLEAYAERIEARTDELVAMAHRETALPASPRLKDVELPRTTGQLRQAAAAAREGSWALPTIDTKANIRSMYGPLGPVAVFGPNNFPFAFNGASGGDFAAAVAAGNPVIAKGHSSHPGTSRLLAEAAHEAAQATDMPPGFVQLIYRTSHEDGRRLVSHPLIGATGYTGSRSAGLELKAAADRAGKLIYLELSSINPVFVLPGALEERLEKIADDFTTSCLMGAGQFCTNPGLVVLKAGGRTEDFVAAVAERFQKAPAGTLLNEGVQKSLARGFAALKQAGAEVVTGDEAGGGQGVSYRNTLLRVSGKRFLEEPEALQTEAFGNSSLFVVAADDEELLQIAERLEGNLTGGVYSDTRGGDDGLYDRLEPRLRPRVGRLLNDKMPTGVAVSPAMNHGGPYPATGHPGFTAVGIPAALRRFAMLLCYDGVRSERLPPLLANENPGGAWRLVDGRWTQEAARGA